MENNQPSLPTGPNLLLCALDTPKYTMSDDVLRQKKESSEMKAYIAILTRNKLLAKVEREQDKSKKLRADI